MNSETLAPLTMPDRGLVVIAGPAGSGLSSAALACAQARMRWAHQRAERGRRILLTFAGSGGLAAKTEWDRVVASPEEIAEIAGQLTRELAEPSSTAQVVVVERSAEAEGTPAVSALAALARTARRSSALVVFECEAGVIAHAWDLFTALKRPGWGVALQPDDETGGGLFRESFGRVKRADFPPGRGFAVESGMVMPVHIAEPENSLTGE